MSPEVARIVGRLETIQRAADLRRRRYSHGLVAAADRRHDPVGEDETNGAPNLVHFGAKVGWKHWTLHHQIHRTLFTLAGTPISVPATV